MKVILFTTLLLFFINGFAFNWKKVGEGVKYGGSYYVDVDSIKKHNGLVYYWELIDRLETSPVGWKSVISKYKVDCGEEKVTCLSDTYYSQSMGKGGVVLEDTHTSNGVEYPKPNSVGYEAMKFACDNAK